MQFALSMYFILYHKFIHSSTKTQSADKLLIVMLFTFYNAKRVRNLTELSFKTHLQVVYLICNCSYASYPQQLKQQATSKQTKSRGKNSRLFLCSWVVILTNSILLFYFKIFIQEHIVIKKLENGHSSTIYSDIDEKRLLEQIEKITKGDDVDFILADMAILTLSLKIVRNSIKYVIPTPELYSLPRI